MGIGGICAVIIDNIDGDGADTRVEYIYLLSFFSIIGYISILIAMGVYVENSKWWQERI